jgi:hypothetical protein
MPFLIFRIPVWENEDDSIAWPPHSNVRFSEQSGYKLYIIEMEQELGHYLRECCYNIFESHYSIVKSEVTWL